MKRTITKTQTTTHALRVAKTTSRLMNESTLKQKMGQKPVRAASQWTTKHLQTKYFVQSFAVIRHRSDHQSYVLSHILLTLDTEILRHPAIMQNHHCLPSSSYSAPHSPPRNACLEDTLKYTQIEE